MPKHISFAPDPELFRIGRNHFKRPVDAMGEFIDNSIQACCGCRPSRDISISLFISTNHKSHDNFMVFRDNGCGMDELRIQQYATFALTKEKRNIVPNASGNSSFIGKFGVGAKQAGFYLGKRIKLITKTEDAVHPLQFTLDYEELQRKTSEEQYSGIIETIGVDDSGPFFRDEESYPLLVSSIRDHMDREKQYSIFIIKLEMNIVATLRSLAKTPQSIVRQIADVYHFHLHPEDSYSQLVMELGMHKNKKCLEFTDSTESDLNIYFGEYNQTDRDDVKMTNIRLFEDHLQQCLQVVRGGKLKAFDFYMEVPDLDRNKNEMKFVGVKGIIFYFPFKGRETKPAKVIDQSERNELGEVDSSTQTVYVYWQNRLVPETTIPWLDFFPKPKTSDTTLGKNWKDRILGLLFLDWDFPHISNNKLKLIIDPIEWLSFKKKVELDYDTSQTIAYPPKMVDVFKSWLVTCHRDDQEIVLCNRTQSLPGETHFAQAELQSAQTLKINGKDLIKWRDAFNGQLVYAEVQSFVVEQNLLEHETFYDGSSGKLLYQKLPTAIFGQHINKIRLIDIDLETLKKADPKDIEKLQNEYACTIQGYLFADANSQRERISGVTPMVIGKKYYKLGFQLFNGHKKQVFCLPGHNGERKSSRYYIQISNNEGVEYGTTNDVWVYDAGKNEDVEVLQPKGETVFGNYYYAVYNFQFDKPGDKEITVKILTPERKVIASQVFSLKVEALPVQHYDVLGDIAVPEKIWRFDDSLPAFKIQLQDGNGFPADHQGRIRVLVSSLELKIVYRNGGMSSMTKQLTAQSMGLVEFNYGDWLLSIPEHRPLFSTKDVNNQAVKVKLSVKVEKTEIDRGREIFVPIGTTKFVYIEFIPGYPAKIVPLGKLSLPLLVKVGENVEPLRFGCVDKWGHRTYPLVGEKWTACLQEGPLTARMSAPMLFYTEGGEAECHLKTKDDLDHIPSEGKQMVQEIAIRGDFGVKLEKVVYKLPCMVFRSAQMDSLSVLLDGKPIESPYTVNAGQILQNLHFVLVDDNNIPFKITNQHRGKTTWMECSWVALRGPQHRLREDIPENGVLPDLFVPEVIDKMYYDYKLEMMIEGLMVEYSFQLKVLPSKPVQWKVVSHASIAMGVMIGDGQDLHAKIAGVCLADRYGNNIEYSGREVIPTLLVTTEESADDDEGLQQANMDLDEDPDSTMDAAHSRVRILEKLALVPGKLDLTDDVHPAPTTPNSSSSGGNAKKRKFSDMDEDFQKAGHDGFVLQPNACLTKLRAGQQIDLQVVDDKRLFSASTMISTTAVAGYPAKVKFTSRILNIKRPMSKCEAEIAQFLKTIDLSLTITDKEGNPANLSSVTNVKIDIIGPGGQLIFVKNHLTSSLLRLDINLDAPCLRNLHNATITIRLAYNKRKAGEDLVILDGAKMMLSWVPFNNVVSLSLGLTSSGPYDSAQLRLDDGTYVLELPCESAIPSVQVMTTTANGKAYLPRLEQVTAHGNGLNNLFKARQEADDIFLTAVGSIDASKARLVTGFVQYEETRQGLVTILPPSMRILKVPFHLHFVPLPPVRLALEDHCKEQLEGKIISNSPAVKRVLGKNVVVKIFDKLKNECVFSADYEISCRIMCQNRKSEHLKLLHCNLIGKVFGKINPDNDKEVVFDLLETSKSESITDGEYLLEFSFLNKASNNNTASSAVVATQPIRLCVPFHFINNEDNNLKIASLNDQLKPLKKQLHGYDELNVEVYQVKVSIDRISGNFPGPLREDVAKLQMLKAKKELDIAKINLERRQNRPVVKRTNHPDPVKLAGVDILGTVVDLGFVDDAEDAKLLSLVSSQHIDAVVVQTADAAKHLVQRGVKVVTLDCIQPYQLTDPSGRPRPRTPPQIQSKQLLLPPILLKNNVRPRGNPRHLVNMIRLKDEHETLRDTLFYYLFSDYIVFDDFDSAWAFLQDGSHPPAMVFTKDGVRLERSGCFDPTQRDSIEHLEFVYGELLRPPQGLAKAQQDVQLISEMISLLKKREEKQKQIDSIPIEAIRKRILEIEEEIRQWHL